MEEREEIVREIGIELSDFLRIERIILKRQFLTFQGELLRPAGEAFPLMKEKLEKKGYLPFLEGEGKRAVVRVTALKQEGKKPNPLLNLFLFLVTVGSTLLAGAVQMGVNPFRHPEKIYLGIPFSFTIMAILGAHELGHYFVSRKHGIKASLPYFIPMPTFLGTLGAVIKMRSPIPDRKSLLDVGVAGPLAGFSLAVIAFVVGLSLSEVARIPLEEGGALRLGDSILTFFLIRLVASPPEGCNIFLHPVGFAGWICLLITAPNLFPIGQFDGGHVAYALFGKKQRVIARIAFFSILLFAFFGYYRPGWFWPGWLFWAFFFLVMGFDHPPPLNDLTPLDRKRKIIALIAFLILIISFVPVPFR